MRGGISTPDPGSSIFATHTDSCDMLSSNEAFQDSLAWKEKKKISLGCLYIAAVLGRDK